MFKKKNTDDETEKKVSLFARRGFRYGSMATVFTVVFIAIVVLFNVLVSFLSNKYPMSVDLTANHSYKLSSDTLKFIKKVHQKITITVLADENAYQGSSYASCLKLMQKYPQYNSDISVNFVNLTKNPSFESQYPKESLADYDIIVSSGSKYKHIASTDLLQTTTDETTGEETVTGDQTEQKIDSAIEYVTSENLPVVMFTSGHSEVDSTGVQNLLTQNNYNVETKNIATDGIDSKAVALVIVEPKADFSADEIKKIDAFLTNGGQMGKSLYVFFDPQQSTLPNIEDYTKEWGLQVEKGVIYDQTNAFAGSLFQPIEGSTDSGTVGSLASDMHADLAVARPITLLYQSKDVRTTTAVVSTMDTARLWNPPVVSSQSVQTFQPSSSDKKGPFTVIAKSVKSGTYNNNSVTSNVVVSGSTEFLDQTLLAQSNLTNADIVLNTFNNLGGIKSDINIVAKDKTAKTLNMTQAQVKFLEILFLAVLPIAVLLCGFAVWFRRRHL